MFKLLGTNRVPSTDEAQEIRTSLSGYKVEIADIDAKISLSLAQLDDLQQRRCVLQQRAAPLEALMSPARRLCHELVATIFCMVYDLESQDSYDEQTQVAPIRLSQICSGWRRVALLTPHLWSSIKIIWRASKNVEETIQRRIQILQTWFVRTGSLPLSAYICYQRDPTEHAIGWYSAGRQLVAELLPYSKRWTSLIFYLPSACLLPIWEAVDGVFSQLITLTIVDQHWNLPTATTPTIQKFSQIRQLSLILPRLGPLLYNGPWTQLTFLSLMEDYPLEQSPLSLDGAAYILRECSNVVECHLSIGHSEEAGSIHRGPVVVPRLQTLSLVISDNGLQLLLGVLSVSQLEDLTIKEGWHGSALASFLARCERPLKCLSVRKVFGIPGQELLECLQHVRALASLSMSTCPLEVINALTPPSYHGETPNHICPYLTSLNIPVTDLKHEEPLKTMIARRTINGPGLKEIHIHFLSRNWLTEALKSFFADLRANGVSITHTHGKRWVVSRIL